MLQKSGGANTSRKDVVRQVNKLSLLLLQIICGRQGILVCLEVLPLCDPCLLMGKWTFDSRRVIIFYEDLFERSFALFKVRSDRGVRDQE